MGPFCHWPNPRKTSLADRASKERGMVSGCPGCVLALQEARTKLEGPLESQGQGPTCSEPPVASTQTLAAGILAFPPCPPISTVPGVRGARAPFVWGTPLPPQSCLPPPVRRESQSAPLLPLLLLELLLMAEGFGGFCHLHSSPPPPRVPSFVPPSSCQSCPPSVPQLSSSSAS